MTYLLFREDRKERGYAFVSVFAGPDKEHRVKSGRLRFRNEEWEDLREFLESELAGIVYLEFEPKEEDEVR